MSRDIYAQGKQSIGYFSMALLFVSLVFGMVMVWLIERIVLSRLTWLSKNVALVGASSTLSSRVSIQGNDELTHLGGSINTMLDMLEQAEIERKKIANEYLKRKLDSVGLLAGGLGHDFGNILTALSGNLALAKLTTDPSTETYQFLLGAEKAGGRAKDLAHQLLEFAKGGLPIKKPALLAPLLSETVSLLPRNTAIECTLRIEDGLRLVEIDEGQISQVLTNILINAQQAMPNGGTITIDATNATDSLNNQTVDVVQLCIIDQGVGIAQEHLDRIFDPYFTTKSNGNGLGLAMCYSIISKHGGNITVTSKTGVGTTFTITLPVWYEGKSSHQPHVDSTSQAETIFAEVEVG